MVMYLIVLETAGRYLLSGVPLSLLVLRVWEREGHPDQVGLVQDQWLTQEMVGGITLGCGRT